MIRWDVLAVGVAWSVGEFFSPSGGGSPWGLACTMAVSLTPRRRRTWRTYCAWLVLILVGFVIEAFAWDRP